MIKNERQYRITKAQSQKLEHALETVQEESYQSKKLHPLLQKAEREGLLSQLQDLLAQLREYEDLQSGKASIREIESLGELPQTLIKTRIALGLTQKELADRLGLKEQQIQRYEANDYRAASFARLLEIAQALGIKQQKGMLIPRTKASLDIFFNWLKNAGLEYNFIFSRLIPRNLLASMESNSLEEDDKRDSFVLQMAEIISRVFGWPIDSILSCSTPLRIDAIKAATVSFKVPSRTDNRRFNAYILYVHYLALLELKCTSCLTQSRIPTDPDEVRLAVQTNFGSITFENVLRYVWSLGVPVLPLNDPGAFHGACWRVEGRNIIVLKQRTHSLARWLFDLLHELRHVSQNVDQEQLSLIESNPTSRERRESPDEEAASQFAGDVILSGRAEDLAQLCVKAAKGKVERLKGVVPQVADRENVSVDALANYMAFRLSLQNINWWGTAEKLQITKSNPLEIARNILLENSILENINEVDRHLFMLALSDREE